MNNSVEYQIYIGCNDSHLKTELVTMNELEDVVAAFFERKKINFSILHVQGGYYYDEGWYIYENTLCISIINNHQEIDIISLAKSLSMYMNQKCCLVTRNSLEFQYQ